MTGIKPAFFSYYPKADFLATKLTQPKAAGVSLPGDALANQGSSDPKHCKLCLPSSALKDKAPVDTDEKGCDQVLEDDIQADSIHSPEQFIVTIPDKLKPYVETVQLHSSGYTARPRLFRGSDGEHRSSRWRRDQGVSERLLETAKEVRNILTEGDVSAVLIENLERKVEPIDKIKPRAICSLDKYSTPIKSSRQNKRRFNTSIRQVFEMLTADLASLPEDLNGSTFLKMIFDNFM